MLTLLRTILGALVLSTCWAGFVLLCSSRYELALGAFLTTFFVLPAIVPTAFFAVLRISRKIQKVSWVHVPRLRSKVLHRVLEGSDAPLSLMRLNLGAEDQSFFYFTLPFLQNGRFELVNVLLVSDSWIQSWERRDENSDLMETELDFVLSRMGKSQGRLLRTLQICLWIGQVAILELTLHLLGVVFRILGFRHMPSPVFFCQNLAWSVRRLWFSPRASQFGFWDTRVVTPRVSQPPASWNSLCFGVWGLYPVRHLHPSWRFFVDSDGTIPSAAAQNL